MGGGKWIEELTATTPLEDAARRVLSVRLETVRSYLALALREPEKDAEHVHQLRVSTRRARAALDIFEFCLSGKVFKKAKKRLRSLRQGAGAARDWDVFLETVCKIHVGKATNKSRAGLDFLMGYGLGQRAAAQVSLENSVPNAFAIDRFAADLLHSVRPPEEGLTTLAELARTDLLHLLQELDQAAGQDLSNYEHLHRVRIAGKRLRYEMEVFVSCFAEEFRTVHYPAIEEMQEILGRANDSYVACRRLSSLRAQIQALIPGEWKRYKASCEELIQFHQQRLPEERLHFEEWWRKWNDSGNKAALLNLLQSAG